MYRMLRNRDRMFLVVLAVVALAFGSAACGDSDDDSTATTATDTASDTTATATDTASDTTVAATDTTGDTTAAASDTASDTTAAATDTTGEVVLLVPHRVADWGTWKPVFDEHREVRADYGGSRDLVYRDVDDPNTVVVYMTYPSAGQAEEFFVDPSLAEAMERAGVEPPLPPPHELLGELEVVDYENPGSGVAGDESGGVLLVIRHQVEDYEAWKPVFDEVEDVRREHGATGHRLFSALDDPDDVIVYETYPDAESALGFFNDERLAEAMGRAGVIEDTVQQTLRTLDENVSY